jgi:UDP-N-acetylglucosamine 1-carboxyvinyltransferase
MQSLRVVGGRPLYGTIVASGARNAMTKLIIASLISDKRCTFFNVPDVADVASTLAMCQEVGMEYLWDKQASVLEVQTKELKTSYVPNRFSGSNRVPILMVGALLARSEEDIVVPILSADSTDARPLDFHIEALRTLGATIELKMFRKEGALHASAPHGLRGGLIRLPYPSVGATENSILAAVTARGTTIIKNAAVEPEILELILFLQKLGANIVLDTDRSITIQGTRLFHPVEHSVIADRTEAASFAMLAIASGGRVYVEGAEHRNLITFLNAVREIGGSFSVKDRGIEFWADGPLKGGLHVETDVHPGFMTDWQQPFVVLLTQAAGSSIVHETVYENRFGYVDILSKMGAEISTFRQCLGGRLCRFNDHAHPHSVIVRGKTPLEGTSIAIPDLRAGFAYVMAALLARGESTITGVGFLTRDHERIVEKLHAVGAEISACEEPPSGEEACFDLFSHH